MSSIYADRSVLQERGLTGALELRDETRPYRRITSNIEDAADLTVQDNRKASPRLVKYKPFVLSQSAA